jgi:hypothetical protein
MMPAQHRIFPPDNFALLTCISYARREIRDRFHEIATGNHNKSDEWCNLYYY